MAIIQVNGVSKWYGFRYSKVLAKTYGVKESVLLQAVAWCVKHFHIEHEDKYWFYTSLDTIHKNSEGVLSRSAIHRLLTKLVSDGVLLRKNIYHNGCFRSCLSFASDAILKEALAKEDCIHFCPNDASEFKSIPAAVVMHNISYWVLRFRETNANYSWHQVAAFGLAKLTGLSTMTVQRAIKKLVATGVLEERPCGKQQHEYRIVNEAKYLDVRAEAYHERNTRIEDNKQMKKLRQSEIESSYHTGISPYHTGTAYSKLIVTEREQPDFVGLSNLTNKESMEHLEYV